MPLHEYRCDGCGTLATHYTGGAARDLTPPCDTCQQPATYAGLSACQQRSPKPMGATMRGGKFVEGNFHSAPRRSRRNVTTYR